MTISERYLPVLQCSKCWFECECMKTNKQLNRQQCKDFQTERVLKKHENNECFTVYFKED